MDSELWKVGTRRFDETTRQNIAERCAAFARLPADPAQSELKRAAVAIALVEAAGEGGTALLLTMRAAGLRAHRGQWALPGGRCDEGETVVAASLRELREEVGLALETSAVLGLLDDYPTRSGYLITPVVVWAETKAAISPNPAEVASVHRIAIEDIEQAQAFDFIAIPESSRRVIRFRHEGQFIHAPTAALIYQFREAAIRAWLNWNSRSLPGNRSFLRTCSGSRLADLRAFEDDAASNMTSCWRFAGCAA